MWPIRHLALRRRRSRGALDLRRRLINHTQTSTHSRAYGVESTLSAGFSRRSGV